MSVDVTFASTFRCLLRLIMFIRPNLGHSGLH